jgi:hypothetical protein
MYDKENQLVARHEHHQRREKEVKTEPERPQALESLIATERFMVGEDE